MYIYIYIIITDRPGLLNTGSIGDALGGNW